MKTFFDSVKPLNIAILILAIFFFLIVFGNLFFILGLSVNGFIWFFVLAGILAVMKTYSINYKEGLILIIISILLAVISNFFFDISDDGQGYHLDAVMAFQEGWNPIYEKFDEPISSHLWVQHYSKGKELISAIIYSLTNRIESVKFTNFLIAIACFIFIFHLLKEYLKKGQSLFFAFLITLSPTVITQFLTNYIDGFAYNNWLIFVVTLIFFLKKPNAKNMALMVASATLFSSLKFTSLPVLAITGGLTWVYFIIKKKKLPVGIYYMAIISGVFMLLVNINPYLTNLADGKSLFYPAYGKNINVLSYHLPKEMEKNPNIVKFTLSVFYETGKPHPDYLKGVKWPFSVSVNEIKNMAYTTGLAGYGVFFSGILVLTLPILFITLIWLKPKFKTEIILILIGIIGYAAILPASWMARIIPYAYLIPILILLLYTTSDKKTFFTSFLSKTTRFFLVINVLLFIGVAFIYNLYYSLENRFILSKLKNENQEICVQALEYRSNLIRLDENEIKYELCEMNDDENFIYFKPQSSESGTRIEYEIKGKKTGLLKILDRFYSGLD